MSTSTEPVRRRPRDVSADDQLRVRLCAELDYAHFLAQQLLRVCDPDSLVYQDTWPMSYWLPCFLSTVECEIHGTWEAILAELDPYMEEVTLASDLPEVPGYSLEEVLRAQLIGALEDAIAVCVRVQGTEDVDQDFALDTEAILFHLRHYHTVQVCEYPRSAWEECLKALEEVQLARVKPDVVTHSAGGNHA